MNALFSVRLHGEGSRVSVRDVSARICRLREQLADFDEDVIFKMNDSGLLLIFSRRKPTFYRIRSGINSNGLNIWR